MNKKLVKFGVIFVLAQLIARSAGAEEAKNLVRLSKPISDVTIEAVEKAKLPDDFQILLVKLKGKPLLTVYLGNAPSHYKVLKGQDAREFLRGSMKIISVWSKDELIDKEVLIKLKDKDWPEFLQVSYAKKLNDQERIMAEKLLGSLEFP